MPILADKVKLMHKTDEVSFKVTGIVGVVSAEPQQRANYLKSLSKNYKRLRSPVVTLDQHSSIVDITLFTENKIQKISSSEQWVYVIGVKTGSPGNESTLIDEVPTKTIGTLQGQFAGFIAENNKFALFTDHVGCLNLYYSYTDSAFLFSTSSMVLAASLKEFIIDQDGCFEFLTVGYPIADRTFYKNIKLTPPGVVWYFSENNLPTGRRLRYWKPEEISSSCLKAGKAFSLLKYNCMNTLNELIQKYDKPICDFTAGFDSRGIVAIMQNAGISMTSVVNGPLNSIDVKVATAIAKKYGWNHIINNSDETAECITNAQLDRIFSITDGEIPLTDYIRPFWAQQRAQKKFNLSVNGSGGELLRGYWWEGEFPYIGKHRAVNIEYFIKRLILPSYNWNIHLKGLQDIIEKKIKAEIVNIFNMNADLPNTNKIDLLYLLLRMGRWCSRYWSTTFTILPCSSPFLYKDIIEISLKLPAKAKIFNRFYRSFLYNMHPEIAGEPMENGCPALPFSIRNSVRFTPLIKFYAQKIYNRIQCNKQISQSVPTYNITTRTLLFLQKEEGLIDFILSDNSISSNLYKIGDLKKLLEISYKENFALFPDQIARIYTLEKTFQIISELRSA